VVLTIDVAFVVLVVFIERFAELFESLITLLTEELIGTVLVEFITVVTVVTLVTLTVALGVLDPPIFVLLVMVLTV